jgi:hypothetical protein
MRFLHTGLLSMFLATLWLTPLHASSVKHQNIVDLIDLAEIIVSGQVAELRDGIDTNGVPFTEIAILVSESIRGDVSGTLTFRQFGLLTPRQMPDGRVNLNVIPDGWPMFVRGEEVVLFLYQAAPLTGLRTTVGLFQGKFTLQNDGLVNAINNQGLFKNVAVDPATLGDLEQKMVAQGSGALRPDTFVNFVRRAVNENWIQSGRLGHAQQ